MLANEYSICYKGTNYQLYGPIEDPFFKVDEIMNVTKSIGVKNMGMLMIVETPVGCITTRMVPVEACCINFDTYDSTFGNAVREECRKLRGKYLAPDTTKLLRSQTFIQEHEKRVTVGQLRPYNAIVASMHYITSNDGKCLYAVDELRRSQYAIGRFYENLLALGITSLESKITDQYQCRLARLTALVVQTVQRALHDEPTQVTPKTIDEFMKHNLSRICTTRPLIQPFNTVYDLEQYPGFDDMIKRQKNYRNYNKSLNVPNYDADVIEYTQKWIATSKPYHMCTKKLYYDEYCGDFKKYAVCEIMFDTLVFEAGYGLATRDERLCWARPE